MQTFLDLKNDTENIEDVFLVADAISSQRPYNRTVALQRMLASGAILTTAESAAFELMKTTHHPQFKTVVNLIKQRNSSGFIDEFSSLTDL